jgi:lactadherin
MMHYMTSHRQLWLLLLSLLLQLQTTSSAVNSAANSAANPALYPTIQALQACVHNGPLGMTTGAIQNSQISASSNYPPEWDKGCNQNFARVYQPNGLGWCSKFKSASEWLQVDLGVPAKVTGLMTQGRGDGSEWVTSFLVSFSLDAYHWQYITDQYGNQRVFEGNTDSYSVKHSYLDEAIIARYVKFHTAQWNKHPSMRVEIIGCQVCKTPLALPPYGKVTASSERSPDGGSSCQPEDGYIITNKAWCAKSDNTEQWLQFDIGPPTLVTGLVTKGRGDGPKKHWVTKFRVSYSNDTHVWHYYKENSLNIKDFGGNVDREFDRYHFLGRPFVARFIRFHPVDWHKHISMRAGLLGCPYMGRKNKYLFQFYFFLH